MLVMEPYAPLRHSLVQLLEEDGYQAVAAAHVDEVLAHVRSGEPALVLFGTRFPLREGRDFLDQLAREPGLPSVPVVVLSPRSQWPEGAADLLEMPFSLEQLRAVVARHAGWAGRSAPQEGAAAG